MSYDFKDVEKTAKRIAALTTEIKKRQDELARLTGHLREQKAEPAGFDYREAVLTVFIENSSSDLSIDDVFQKISSKYEKYKFTPDRFKIANRLNYLTDTDKKLERAKPKRGVYRLASKTDSPRSQEQGIG